MSFFLKMASLTPIDPLVRMGVVLLGVVQLGSVQMGVDHHFDKTPPLPQWLDGFSVTDETPSQLKAWTNLGVATSQLPPLLSQPVGFAALFSQASPPLHISALLSWFIGPGMIS